VVQHLTSKYEALSSNLITDKRKRKERKENTSTIISIYSEYLLTRNSSKRDVQEILRKGALPRQS
jgi:hypothetical protein